MLTALMLAGSLPLATINLNDGRLEKANTFVSEKAELVLAGEEEGEVLCLDRRTEGSICLERNEWERAVNRANAMTNLRNHYFAVSQNNALNR